MVKVYYKEIDGEVKGYIDFILKEDLSYDIYIYLDVTSCKSLEEKIKILKRRGSYYLHKILFPIRMALTTYFDIPTVKEIFLDLINKKVTLASKEYGIDFYKIKDFEVDDVDITKDYKYVKIKLKLMYDRRPQNKKIYKKQKSRVIDLTD